MIKAEFKCESIGLGLTEHNYLCAVCLEKSAVHYTNEDTLHPCWDCQEKGFHLIKIGKFMSWVIKKLGYTI